MNQRAEGSSSDPQIEQGNSLSDTTVSAIPSAALAAVQPEIPGYRISHLIAEGGMGSVWEAEETKLRRRVALKVIRPGLKSGEMHRSFDYEAAILARLEHVGIARIYHAGIAETAIGRQPFFAMEFIEGTALDEFVRDTRPTTKQRLELMIKVCDGVHYAHTKGIIHRDVKPSNILVTPDGQPK
ncbi:MAG: serine/threonine-protein kinase, partial [Tepidisphaeraceae bacterium]